MTKTNHWNTSAAKAKLNELFIQWLTLPDTQDQLGNALEQRAKRPRLQLVPPEDASSSSSSSSGLKMMSMSMMETKDNENGMMTTSSLLNDPESSLMMATTTTTTTTGTASVTMTEITNSNSNSTNIEDDEEDGETTMLSAPSSTATTTTTATMATTKSLSSTTTSASSTSSTSSLSLELLGGTLPTSPSSSPSNRHSSPPPRSPTSSSASSSSSTSSSTFSNNTTLFSSNSISPPSLVNLTIDNNDNNNSSPSLPSSLDEEMEEINHNNTNNNNNNKSSNDTKRHAVRSPLSFANIPRFYFPSASGTGGLGGFAEHAISPEDLKLIQSCFTPKTGSRPRTFSFSDFPDLFDALFQNLFPFFFTTLLFVRIDVDNTGSITQSMVESFWRRCIAGKSEVDRFFFAIKNPATANSKPQNGIVSDDFFPILNELLEVHPGLSFLKGSGFQERYAETVVIRIFYSLDRRGSGSISLQNFRKSSLVAAFQALACEEDINKIRDFFSYEHFYVLYCKFWELDTNHDSLIDMNDLIRYSNYSLTPRIVKRIFSGVPRKLTGGNGMMTYEDFVWFCISEEDKTSDTSLEYWFRCVDLDCDGCVSGFEIEFFFLDQLQRMATMSQEVIPLEDILVQMIDMIKPADPRRITLKDLKKCKMAGVFFNALFNLNKFILYESRNPFSIQQEHNSTEQLSDWDKFARVEYDRLAHGADDGDDIANIEGSDFESMPMNMDI